MGYAYPPLTHSLTRHMDAGSPCGFLSQPIITLTPVVRLTLRAATPSSSDELPLPVPHTLSLAELILSAPIRSSL